MATDLGIGYGHSSAAKAHAEARAVAKKLGKGWITTVHSYFGWKWRLHKGDIELASPFRGEYVARLDKEDSSGEFIGVGHTPASALNNLKREVARHLKNAQGAVESLKVLSEGSPPRGKSPARKPAVRRGKSRKVA